MGAGEVDVVVSEDRCGNGNIPATRELPEFCTGGEIVASGVMPAIQNNLSPV
jgi:hypothetical protein